MRKRVIKPWRRQGLVANCPDWRDSYAVTPQKTQARQRLGVLIKTRRRRLGMRTQDELSAKTGLSVSVISLAERGNKVDDQTLLSIEYGLEWPTNSTVEYLRTSDESLLPIDLTSEPSPAEAAGPSARERLRALEDEVDQLLSRLKDIQREAAALEQQIEDQEGPGWRTAL